MVEGILTSRRLVCLALAMGFAACGPPASSATGGPGAMAETTVEERPISPQPPAATEQPAPSTDDDYRQGVRYLTGDGVPKDVLKAAQLILSAAERGHAESQYLIGVSHGLPWGAKYDPALSASWLERAADQGHDRAQFLVGEAYANGLGVEPEPAWAALWYRRAAEQGHVKAQFRLALLLISGTGVTRDWIEAGKWLQLASAQGDQEATRYWRSLADLINDKEREQSIAAARRWRAVAESPRPDGPLVRFIQHALARLGYEPGPVDGVIGARTRQAVRDFQLAQGMAPHTDAVANEVVAALRAKLRDGS